MFLRIWSLWYSSVILCLPHATYYYIRLSQIYWVYHVRFTPKDGSIYNSETVIILSQCQGSKGMFAIDHSMLPLLLISSWFPFRLIWYMYNLGFIELHLAEAIRSILCLSIISVLFRWPIHCGWFPGRKCSHAMRLMNQGTKSEIVGTQ